MSRASPGLSSTNPIRSIVATRYLGGSLTIVNQKLSIALTTVMNCSMASGFVT